MHSVHSEFDSKNQVCAESVLDRYDSGPVGSKSTVFDDDAEYKQATKLISKEKPDKVIL